MTLLSSWRLVLLLGPFALLAVYLQAQRRRQRTLVRFTNVDMLASVAPHRTGWQRHIPAGILLGSLVVLVVAFSQPAVAVRTPRQRATVMLTIDTSGSMIANDVAPTRIAAAQDAAKTFAAALPPGVQLGLVSFASNARVLVAPTADRAAIMGAIDQLQAGGGTATGDAIDLALSAIKSQPPAADGTAPPATIVLMSDGAPTIGRGDQSPAESVASATAAARQAHVSISTIAFGTPDGTVFLQGRTIAVPSDPAAMAQIAADSGGRTFRAQTPHELKSVYAQIGRAVGYDVHRREVTAWLTGLALVLAMGAAGAALIWNQRLT